ncbi:malto-oligosyltrehalose trehalohydrolase [Corynebacterium anserum]|uniref:Malto-oligosyltrehalose trehalohydrolase n=1 Tax=Corynebacterium anserum TaxID=2684406 RepID=A0A7G7YN06_9CORY|nr:malto-oligosyltrehalose trehalohydrolase [Corynebacterium anserum]MBC2680889.1 malto-oligosyltrehalose trehalohydrolase [Corynebacterium anserum]QNH95876.1 malto-oligosyltrehalose trehalohydrolase [Corynebacterium anserum]
MFSVWAPKAESVELDLNGTRRAMTREGDWFVADCERSVGARYGFSVDGSPVFPDPRSRRQPDGIHGLSQVWEPKRTPEPLGRPLKGEVIYEMHVGTFTPEGTLDSAIERFNDLKDVGVTAIELMPIQPFGGQRNWGYDGVSWHAVSELYGGPDALLRFVEAAHNTGLAVILDVVYNHFGPDGNYTGVFGPYTSGGSTGWGEVVNIQGQLSDEVRSYILDAVKIWTKEFGIDGLRLDAVHALDDVGAVSIIEQMRDVAAPSYLIAETDQNDPKFTERFGVAQWNDDVHHAIHAVVSGEKHAYYSDFGTVEVLATTFQRVFWHDGRFSTFRGRTHGRALEDPDYSQFVVYTTTHDQTGNRAAGDRPNMNLTVEQQLAKAALVLTSPFTVMLFQGEEWGASTPFAFFVDHEDSELNRLTAEGRMREFARAGWDPQIVPNPADEKTFLDSKLDWSERTSGSHARVLTAYKELLALRKKHKLYDAELIDVAWHSDEELSGQPFTVPRTEAGDVDYEVSGRWIELTYQAPESVVSVVVNLSDQPARGLAGWGYRVDIERDFECDDETRNHSGR